MDRYEVIICWSNEDQVFTAEVPELPSCMVHGATPEDTLVNIKSTMEL
jgi:predicted RNase H-like HicB family nuclease